MNDRRFARHLVVIPCASSKVDHDAPAAQLYDSANFHHMLPAGYFQPVWEAVNFINEEGDDADPWIDLMNTYEAAPGIGFQRGVASALVRLAA